MGRTKRIALVLLLFTAVALVGRTSSFVFGVFWVGIFLIFILTVILLILSVVLVILVIRTFNKARVLRTVFLVLIAAQCLIMVFWWAGWTAASAFGKHSRTIGLSVIDPQLERVFMIGFWLLAAFLFALFVDYVGNVFLNNRESSGKNFYKKRIGVWLLEGFLLMGMHSSHVSYRRLGGRLGVVTSVSSDGIRAIQLLPMNAGFDTNGLVIVQNGQAPIWSTAGEIGDELTGSEGNRFVWSADNSEAFLLVTRRTEKEIPLFGYNFRTKMEVDPDTYRK